MNTPFRGHSAVEIDAKRAKRIKDVSVDAPRYLNTFLRAFSGKSRVSAMNAFCIECMGFDAAEVRICAAPSCPLYQYRPGRKKGATV